MAVISNIYRALTEFLVCAPKRWGEVMFKFLGGIHPNDGKRLAMDSAIEQMPIPKTLVVPMGQHIGAPCTPCVKPGDTVKKGQLIGTSEAFMHADIHSPTSGTVKKVAPMPHSGMGSCMAVVIESDGEDTWADGLPLSRDWQQMDPDEILSAIQNAGIVGMGGETFLAHIKLKPAKPVDVLILNGAECEPYLTADYRLMLEEPDKIVTGTEILKKLLSVKNAYIGIEDNKPEAIKKMKEAVKGHDGIEVAALRTKYPQGAEKMLIKSITDREVPTGGLPMDVGAAVQNVGTVAAITDAVTKGIPLIERITTVSGDAVKSPKNIRAKIGTTYREMIAFAGGFKEEPSKLLAGGPMMGMAQSTLDVPVMKGSSGILGLTKKLTEHPDERACIRCGRCVRACPMQLIPSMLSILSERRDFDKARIDYGLMNCVECGCCTYVCPAKRNIVHYIKNAKAVCKAEMVKAKAKAKAKAEAEAAKQEGKEAAK